MTLRISMSLHRHLIALAAADPTREVCGLLLGSADAVEAIVEARNVAADPAITFEIDPRAQIDAHKAARDGRAQVIGCYHSHPTGMARPSARDLELAQRGSLWLIVADDGIAAWRRGEAQFSEVQLSLVG